MKENYIGWTNKQTWNINLRYSEIFSNMCEEQEYDDIGHIADSFESLVNELEFDGVTEHTLAHDVLSDYLNQVDWEEIAEKYAYDFDLFKEEEVAC
jgi:urocanate hydratase